MRDRAIRAALERTLSDMEDQEQVHAIYHDDVVLEFPQSGERIVGLANVRAMREAYPARVIFTPRRIRGGGALWVAEVALTYDGGEPNCGVAILEFRGEKVAHETIYVGHPWEPPAWRAQWVEVDERTGGVPAAVGD